MQAAGPDLVEKTFDGVVTLRTNQFNHLLESGGYFPLSQVPGAPVR